MALREGLRFGDVERVVTLPLHETVPTVGATASSSRTADEDLTQNQKPQVTRSYLRAPKLKPQTGWKPWPKPIMAEPANWETRVTMLMAAMAASP